MELNICHLYPDILNLYGDRGNIITMKRRLESRGISVNVVNYLRLSMNAMHSKELVPKRIPRLLTGMPDLLIRMPNLLNINADTEICK